MLSVRQNRYIEEKELTVLPDAAAKLLRFLLTFLDYLYPSRAVVNKKFSQG